MLSARSTEDMKKDPHLPKASRCGAPGQNFPSVFNSLQKREQEQTGLAAEEHRGHCNLKTAHICPFDSAQGRLRRADVGHPAATLA